MSRNRKRPTNNKGVKSAPKKTTFAGNLNTALAENFGNINYSYIPGAKIWKDVLNNTFYPHSLPGLMTFRFIPTIGINKGSAAPINLVSNKLYAKLRAVNSGAKNYDPNNLMITLMAMDSIYSYHAFMLRVYGTIAYYDSANLNVPDMLLLGMGVNPISIRANVKQLLGYINLFAARANRLSIPDVLPIIKEHARLCNNVYTDHNDVKGQMYMFQPAGFYHYIENADVEAEKFGSLEFEWFEADGRSRFWNFETIVKYGNHLLEDALNSEDIAIICGDVQKAFDASELLVMPVISESYLVDPFYDPEILVSIHNAMTLETKSSDLVGPDEEMDPTPININVGPITANGTDNNISQDITYTVEKMTDSNSPISAFWTDKFIIDQVVQKPTLSDNYAAIRFKYAFNTDEVVPDTGIIPLSAYGTELLINPEVWAYADPDNTGDSVLCAIPVDTVTPIADSTNATKNTLRSISLLSSFDMAPIVYHGTATAGNIQLVSYVKNDIYPIGQLHNPTLITTFTMKHMFIAYFMSAFGVE